MMSEPVETKESGPIQTGIWDTRTRENCEWCDGCEKWLSLWAFSWLPRNERLAYHKEQYCKGVTNETSES